MDEAMVTTDLCVGTNGSSQSGDESKIHYLR